MQKIFRVCRILFFVAVSLFLVAVSPALPALAPPGELAEGKTWSYAVKLGGQLFGIDKITVIIMDPRN
jgi:hypothetical protein